MSSPPHPAAEDWGWLPRWLRPGEDRPEGARGLRRRIEILVLLAIALVLVVATVNDIFRQVHVNQRLARDESTFRRFTGHRPHKISLLAGVRIPKDTACAQTDAGSPRVSCLIISGPVHAPIRQVIGGYTLPSRTVRNTRASRSGCFGVAAGTCGA